MSALAYILTFCGTFALGHLTARRLRLRISANAWGLAVSIALAFILVGIIAS